MSLHASQTSVMAPAALLVTKLRPPRPRVAAPMRSRLLDRLRVESAPLVVVTAGAGFGKSTLLGHWVASLDRHVAWVSLDEADNDEARFWSHVLASLQEVLPRFAAYALELIRAPTPAPREALLTELVNELAAAGPVVLVLDDYHHIDDPDIHGAITFLLSHLPDDVVVGIGSRSAPPLPLARMRGRGEMSEIDADALRATYEEAEAFLRSGMSLDLNEAAIGSVLEKTEGWFAGLQLAALALRGRETSPEAIEAFSGEHRLVLEYLTEEVLRGQSVDVQRFLVEASLLSRMDASLCDDVLERRDSAHMLGEVSRANLFVDSLDDANTWWRFHTLFAELLQARLLRTDPERAVALHGRAARAFVGLGDVGEAVRHHLAAGDGDAAATLVASSTLELLEVGGVGTLLRWLGAIPREAYESHPELYIALGWATAYSGDAPSVPSILVDAEVALSARGEADGPLSGEIAALRTHVASMEGRTEEATALARTALMHLGEERHWVRGNLLFGLGLALQKAGAMDEAAAESLASARAFTRAGSRHGWLYATYQLGEIRRYQGSLREAERTYGTMLRDGPPKRMEREPALAHAYAGLGKVALERYELEEALRHGEDGRAASATFELGARVDAVLTLALVQQARGELDAAESTFEQVSTEARASTRFAWVERRVSTFRAGLALSRGQIGDAARWREALGDAWQRPLGDAGWRPAYQERHPELMMLLRLSLAEGDGAALDARLAACIGAARACGLRGHVLELRALEAEARLRVGRDDEARAVLAAALESAAPEGHVRPFLVGGARLLPLLDALAADGVAHARRVMSRARGATVDGGRRDGAERASPAAAATDVGRSGWHDGALASRRRPRARDETYEPLTDRERTVVRLMVAGASNKAIARELDVSVNTVKTHVRTAYAKLGVSSRAQLATVVRDGRLLD